MKTTYIDINKKENGEIQYLTEVLLMIPKNTILYKKLTGLGATYGEIKANRNSIILEPNVPVIEGKCADPKHKEDNLLGVYEGVYTDDIILYIVKSIKAKKNIKILSTPESFKKVKAAFQEIEINMYYECFLLYDECHKLIKDVDYRSDIALPMNDFFQFEEKALVSATPLYLTDPRFEEQNFSMIEIIPQFEYIKKINLFFTNNVLQAVKFILEQLERSSSIERPICFFINSTDIIYSFIKQLGIEDKSFVFCADKSVDKLKEHNFLNASSRWDKTKMKKYNFFTSRFYNAVDIELDEKPDIILVSDVYYAEHSATDPKTDSIQTIGRFRNGVSYKFHVFNTNKNFPERTLEDIKDYIHECGVIYNALSGLYESATTRGARDAYQAAIDNSPFNQFLDENGEKNYFAIDNYIDEALLKGYYTDEMKLLEAYRNTNTFQPYFYRSFWKLGDYDKLIRENKSISLKEKRKIIVSQMESLGDIDSAMYREFRDELYFVEPQIVEAYETIGKEEIERLKYRMTDIKEAMIVKRFQEHPKGAELKELIYNRFQEGQVYTVAEIKKELIRIYKLVGITSPKAITGQTIRDYFLVPPTETKKKGERALLLIARKY